MKNKSINSINTKWNENTNSWIDVFIRFGSPYSDSSNECTGVRMIRDGFAHSVSDLENETRLILYPYTTETLSIRDQQFALENGIELVDAPWETLESIVMKRKSENSSVIVRSIPKKFIAMNEYYRQENPKYFSEKSRFSTVEAALIALLLLKQEGQARIISEKYNLGNVVNGFYSWGEQE